VKRCRVGLVAAALLALGACAHAAVRSPSCATATKAIPSRPPGSATGGGIAQRVAALVGPERDAAIRDELLTGNLPEFLRQAVPVELAAEGGEGHMVRVTLCVLPDYLAVGNDADHLLMPMGLDAALAVAQAFGFTLPTRKIVDAIYAQAPVHLAPHPLPPGDEMRSTAYCVRHNEIVQAQRASAQAPLSALTAGHKKDLVLSERLWQMPGRVAIYGWHRDPGSPIQPLSTVHGARYADYSHGVRLVSTTAFVDGIPRSIFDLLADARLSSALSDEGPLPQRSGSVLQQRNPR